MRWEALFRDLEAQLDAAEDADVAAEVADRTRAEAGRLRLADRLRPAVGSTVTIDAAGGQRVTGRVAVVGADWVLLAESSAREALVPLRAIVAVRGLSARSSHPGAAGAVESRLGLAHALRRVCRDRATASVMLVDGRQVIGVVDRVGRDFVELTESGCADERRTGPVVTVAMDGIAIVRAS